MVRKFLLSSDIAGILGNPNDWINVSGKIVDDKNFDGFEIIGWSWTKEFFLDPKNRHKIRGIHGRTAGWSEGRDIIGSFLLASLNLIFLTNRALVEACPHLKYILLHRGSVDKKTFSLLISKKDKIPLIFIENDIVPNSLTKTINLILELRSYGVNAGMTVDLVHFLREPEATEPNLARWDLLIKMIKSLKNLDFPLNCHFPIGDYENDSLPVNDITDQMWSELSEAMSKIPFTYVVLENQARRRYSLFLTKSEEDRLRNRTYNIYEKLKSFKII